MSTKNLFELTLPPSHQELDTTLLEHPNAHIKKIISPPNFTSAPFCQHEDEWVSLLQGEATLVIDGTPTTLKTGDALFIPANTPHQVLSTSQDPLAIWLAVHLYM